MKDLIDDEPSRKMGYSPWGNHADGPASDKPQLVPHQFTSLSCPTASNCSFHLQSACMDSFQLGSNNFTNLISPVLFGLPSVQTPFFYLISSNSHLQSAYTDTFQFRPNNFLGSTNFLTPALSQPALLLLPPKDLLLPQQPCQMCQQVPTPGIFKAAGGEVPLIHLRVNNDCDCNKAPSEKSTCKKWEYHFSPYVNSSQQVDGLIAKLVAVYWESSTYDVEAWVLDVQRLMDKQMDMFQDQTLHSIVLQYIHL